MNDINKRSMQERYIDIQASQIDAREQYGWSAMLFLFIVVQPQLLGVAVHVAYFFNIWLMTPGCFEAIHPWSTFNSLFLTFACEKPNVMGYINVHSIPTPQK